MIDDASHWHRAGAQPCGCTRYDHTDNLAISPFQLYLVRAPRLGLETERCPWPDAATKPSRLELAGAVQVAGLSLGGKGQEPCVSLSLFLCLISFLVTFLDCIFQKAESQTRKVTVGILHATMATMTQAEGLRAAQAYINSRPVNGPRSSSVSGSGPFITPRH